MFSSPVEGSPRGNEPDQNNKQNRWSDKKIGCTQKFAA